MPSCRKDTVEFAANLTKDVQRFHAILPEGHLRTLLTQRFIDICQDETYCADDHGEFFLLQPGDTVAAVEAAAGVWITCSGISAARYGDPGFVPCFEVLEEHLCCFELVFILNDGGCGIVLLIPKVAGMDAELMRFCREFATPYPSP
jgi:hypothetical protein